MARLTGMATGLLAINWEPEIRGVLIIVIAVSLFCGSIYVLLATNLGARLGFLVALTGLMGWMTLMGIMWSIYGIGLKGPDPTWNAVPGRTVLQDTDALFQAGVFDQRVDIPEGVPFPEEADVVADEFRQEGWTQLSEDDPSFSQAAAAASVFLENSGAFAAGEFQAQRVFDIGGERYPMIGDFDLFAFFHKPRYAVVEVAPLVLVRTEPGRAPPPATVDDTRQRQYVYMIRDLGARRQPAFVLTFGAGLIFLTGCWLLHRRDRMVTENRSREVVPVGSS
jgi:hypothetical protein